MNKNRNMTMFDYKLNSIFTGRNSKQQKVEAVKN